MHLTRYTDYSLRVLIYLAVQQELGLTRGEIQRLAANSIKASFLPTEDKQVLLDELDHYVSSSTAARSAR